jgi:hypothetical protein
MHQHMLQKLTGFCSSNSRAAWYSVQHQQCHPLPPLLPSLLLLLLL